MTHYTNETEKIDIHQNITHDWKQLLDAPAHCIAKVKVS